MKSWKRIALWAIVGLLVFSFAVCQKKAEQAKTTGAPKAEESSSVSTPPVEKSEPEEKPVDTTAAQEKEKKEEPVIAEEKPEPAAEEPKAAEPEKSAEAAPAKPTEPVTRDNAAAIIELEKGGRIVIEFYPKDAPNTVDNFIKLANKGFYDGLTFHRVVPDFVVQGGCPQGTGTGGPGYQIKAEFNSRKHLNGTLAMARSSHPDSAGSQFYICLGPQSFLDNEYTVFGQTIEGMDLVTGIVKGDVMKKVTIVHKDSVEK